MRQLFAIIEAKRQEFGESAENEDEENDEDDNDNNEEAEEEEPKEDDALCDDEVEMVEKSSSYHMMQKREKLADMKAQIAKLSHLVQLGIHWSVNIDVCPKGRFVSASLCPLLARMSRETLSSISAAKTVGATRWVFVGP